MSKSIMFENITMGNAVTAFSGFMVLLSVILMSIFGHGFVCIQNQARPRLLVLLHLLLIKAPVNRASRFHLCQIYLRGYIDHSSNATIALRWLIFSGRQFCDN